MTRTGARVFVRVCACKLAVIADLPGEFIVIHFSHTFRRPREHRASCRPPCPLHLAHHPAYTHTHTYAHPVGDNVAVAETISTSGRAQISSRFDRERKRETRIEQASSVPFRSLSRQWGCSTTPEVPRRAPGNQAALTISRSRTKETSRFDSPVALSRRNRGICDPTNFSRRTAR